MHTENRNAGANPSIYIYIYIYWKTKISMYDLLLNIQTLTETHGIPTKGMKKLLQTLQTIGF